jgi:tetratricopeptide (TPR) repeat protein
MMQRKTIISKTVLGVALLLTAAIPVAALNNVQESEQSWADDMNRSALAIAQLRAREAEPLLKHSLAIAETIDPSHQFFSLVKLGYCFYKMQDLNTAESCYRQALKLVADRFPKSDSTELPQAIIYRQLSTIAAQKENKADREKYNAESQQHEAQFDRERLKCPEYYADVNRAVQEQWKKKGRGANTLAVLRFAVGPNGSIQLLHLAASSGNENDDKLALDAVTSIGKFAPPPPAAPSPLFFMISFNQNSESWNDIEIRLKANMEKMETDANVPLVERINTFGEYGNFLLNKGDFSGAESYFAKALDLTDQLPSKQQAVARIYWSYAMSRERQKKFIEADEYLVKAITLAQSRLPEGKQFYIDLLKARANILSVMGRSEDLVKCLEEINALAKSPAAVSPPRTQ